MTHARPLWLLIASLAIAILLGLSAFLLPHQPGQPRCCACHCEHP